MFSGFVVGRKLASQKGLAIVSYKNFLKKNLDVEQKL